MFQCKSCTGQDKRQRGCVRPRRSPIQVYKCPVCGGDNKKCGYCKGTNEIKLKRCPRATLDSNIISLVPYFYHYIKTNQYPDGRARFLQPVKLLMVFDIWEKLLHNLEKKYGNIEADNE
jgi:hypothetical protein